MSELKVKSGQYLEVRGLDFEFFLQEEYGVYITVRDNRYGCSYVFDMEDEFDWQTRQSDYWQGYAKRAFENATMNGYVYPDGIAVLLFKLIEAGRIPRAKYIISYA